METERRKRQLSDWGATIYLGFIMVGAVSMTVIGWFLWDTIQDQQRLNEELCQETMVSRENNNDVRRNVREVNLAIANILRAVGTPRGDVLASDFEERAAEIEVLPEVDCP
jgi:3-keto-L-gulonate-6-phosphate decarboxylase